ncbi:NADPH:quinone oxidoreductase-like [Punica granatum]|uniref:NADPH:quinone oxidoreductase-like n=2 Tax=Punica granatum TaxID=22663 RepID=A0A6P8CXE9_PUNGR|nr:NADPH:quinone oxidoreductase-like [Punica granatum]PKI68698.1 hypothetical protein CRG98_010755 [Punica granatum]
MEAATGMAAPTAPIKVAAICGSLLKGSYNRRLIRLAIEMSKETINGMEIELVEVADLPLMNVDLEVDGALALEVEEFRQKILQADAVLFASPEYNYSVTPVLKNALDWASRPPNVWAGKAAAIVSTGGGPGGGARAQYHLRQIGVFLDLHFVNKPEVMLSVHNPPGKFDDDGNLVDPKSKEKLRKLLISLHNFALRLRGPC